MKNLLHRFQLPVFLLMVLCIGMSFVSQAQITYTWNGSVSTAWNVAANWSKSAGTFPGSLATDVVVIPTNATNYPNIGSANYTIGRIASTETGATIDGTGILTISAAGTTTIVTGVTATINCPLNITAATTFSIAGSGKLFINGNLTASATITKSSNTGDLILGTCTIQNLTIGGNSVSKVTLAGTATINGLLTLTNGQLIIGPYTLIAKGGISRGTGTLTGSSESNLTLSGSGNENLFFTSGLEELRDLVLSHNGGSNSTSTLNSVLIVYRAVTFGSSKDILNLNDKSVTLKSSASTTAYIGEIKGTLNKATNVTVERYIDGTTDFTFKRAWRLLTIPVTGGQTIRDSWCGPGVAANENAALGDPAPTLIGTLITGHGYSDGTVAAAAGYDWFTGLSNLTTSSIRYYSTANSWASSTNTPSTLIAPDKEGYMLYVRGDRTAASSSAYNYTTLTPTGTLKQGTITIPVADNYTVVGNPYASPINLDAVYNNSGNSTVIKRNFWVWDATLGTAGAYRALSGDGLGNYTMTSIGGGVAADYLVINSSQAFFVEKEGAGGDITIEENDKVATTTPPVMFRPTGTAGTGVSKLDIKLFQATGSTIGLQADGVVGRYNNIYSVSPNETYDAAKMNNFNENLSLVRNGRYMSIESRPYPTQKDTLFISFWGLKNRDYAFTISSTMFAGINQTALLIDNFTNTQTILDMNDGAVTYPFSVTSNVASSSLNRFLIVMAPATVLPVTFTKINASLIGSKVQVSWATGSELGVKNYSIERSADGTNFNKIGEVAAINAANGASYQFADNQPLPANNYYRIRSNDADGKYAFSNIAAVQLNGKKGMQVMPTVITNQRFTLALNDQPAGNYQLKITNTAGQQVYQKMINNMGGNNTQVIELGNTAMPTGVYNLSVSGLNGSNQNFRLLIQN